MCLKVYSNVSTAQSVFPVFFVEDISINAVPGATLYQRIVTHVFKAVKQYIYSTSQSPVLFVEDISINAVPGATLRYLVSIKY